MPRPLNQTERNELEGTIDTHGLHNVVMALVEICGDKAIHVATNWQDDKLATLWTRSASCLSHAAMSAAIQSLP